MADDQGARSSPEIPLPIRVIRSGQIVYQVGSLADLVRLAQTNKLLPSDKIAGHPSLPVPWPSKSIGCGTKCTASRSS